MNDLISRSALFKELNDNNIPWNRQINDIIMAQPTAYNVDKVVEELEEKQIEINRNTSLHYLYSEGYSDAIDYLIDIVRKGGTV